VLGGRHWRRSRWNTGSPTTCQQHPL